MITKTIRKIMISPNKAIRFEVTIEAMPEAISPNKHAKYVFGGRTYECLLQSLQVICLKYIFSLKEIEAFKQ
jgi:hypothetical protein